MIENIAYYFSKRLSSDTEEQEILQYGLECFINTLIPTIFYFTFAVLQNMIFKTIIWIVLFLLLRNYIGGYHASSHARCITLSTLYGLLTLFCIYYFNYIPLIVEICSCIIITIFHILTSHIKLLTTITIIAILTNKAGIARENNIDFRCRVLLAPDYNSVQLLVALSNLIDNAIEHELAEPENLRHLTLSIIQDVDSINITLENYISQSILDTNPTLATMKSNASEHGMGISNTRSLISSINGIMNFAEEGNSFFAQIIILNQ